MNTGPVLVFPHSIDQAAQEAPGHQNSAPLSPELGNGLNGKQQEPQAPSSEPVASQDAVEVQWNTTDRVIVYEFLNQQGNVILQIPSEQSLTLAQDISQELAQDAAAPKETAAVEGGKNHGD